MERASKALVSHFRGGDLISRIQPAAGSGKECCVNDPRDWSRRIATSRLPNVEKAAGLVCRLRIGHVGLGWLRAAMAAPRLENLA